jgi:DNA polymerase (family 10)
MDNRTLASQLLGYANDLSGGENLYRARAYRRAASSLLMLDRSVEEILDEQGRKGLEQIPGIGAHLSYTIEELVRTGEFKTFPSRKKETALTA